MPPHCRYLPAHRWLSLMKSTNSSSIVLIKESSSSWWFTVLTREASASRRKCEGYKKEVPSHPSKATHQVEDAQWGSESGSVAKTFNAAGMHPTDSWSSVKPLSLERVSFWGFLKSAYFCQIGDALPYKWGVIEGWFLRKSYTFYSSEKRCRRHQKFSTVTNRPYVQLIC